MGYKVLNSFRDINTRLIHAVGTEYPDNVGAERIKKLQDLGYIESDQDEADEQEAVAEVETVDDSNTKAEIEAYLTKEGIKFPSSATKAELLVLLEG